MKKYMFLFLLLIAGCTSSTFIPYTTESFPSHKTAVFVKDTTQISYYYFYLGEYFLDSKTIMLSRNDLLEMILDEGNSLGADLITAINFGEQSYLGNVSGTYYTGSLDKASCVFLRYLRDENGVPIKRVRE